MFRETLQRNAARREAARQAIGILFALIFLCYVALAAAPGARAQSNGFKVVGTQLARAILHKKRHSVAVVDFSGPGARITLLGQNLADAVNAALAKAGGKLRVEDRSQIAKVRRADFYAPEFVLYPESLELFAMDLKVKAIVTGNLTLGPKDMLDLKLNAYRMPGGKGIAALRVTLPMTAEMKLLAGKSVSAPSSAALWKAGYTLPTCISCPHSPYTQEAMRQLIQGTVVLVATIGPNGRVANVSIVQGLPGGLIRQAVDTVKNWQLRPATSPGGKPVACREEVRLNYQFFGEPPRR